MREKKERRYEKEEKDEREEREEREERDERKDMKTPRRGSFARLSLRLSNLLQSYMIYISYIIM